MLMFYSYHKQATSGPCNIRRPSGFWDTRGKAKWQVMIVRCLNARVTVVFHEEIQSYGYTCSIVVSFVPNPHDPLCILIGQRHGHLIPAVQQQPEQNRCSSAHLHPCFTYYLCNCIFSVIQSSQCSTMTFFVARDAWSSLGNMTKEEAMKNYVDDIQLVGPLWDE